MQLEVWSEHSIGLKLKMSIFIALSLSPRAPSGSLTHPAPALMKAEKGKLIIFQRANGSCLQGKIYSSE